MRIPNDPELGPRAVAGGGGFINPYNFVTTPPRPDGGELGDRPPEGHDSYQRDRYTGSIPITITTRTPLLLPDQIYADPPSGEQPRRVGTRRRGTAQDAPALMNGSSVKGVLRSAYEAISNSRLAIVSQAHLLPVAIRQNQEDARIRRLRPAIVSGATHPDGSWSVDVVDALHHDDQPDLRPQPAAWVPRSLAGRLARNLGLDHPSLLDRQEVDAWIHLQRHPVAKFALWRASTVAAVGRLPRQPWQPPNEDWSVSSVDAVKVRGRLLWNHSTFPAGGGPANRSKHDERLVVTAVLNDPGAKVHLEVSENVAIDASLIRQYRGVIESYVNTHETESELRRRYGSYVWDPDRWTLTPGRTLWVHLNRDADSPTVTGIYPAIFGRDAFPIPPERMLDNSHRPATQFEDLSPADRVFGWAYATMGSTTDPTTDSTPQRSAYRGKLRVDPPAVAGDAPSVHTHPDPQWLTTLSNPKTEQYRFYVGQTDQRPLPQGRPRSTRDGYRDDRALRGRKFYIPHTDTHENEPYWNPHRPLDEHDRPAHREYLATSHAGPNTKTAITSWVPAGVTFTTTLWVANLSRTELGALLWLLALPDAAVLRMGLGKPLGFGAVRFDADWDGVRIHSRAGLIARYRSLDASLVPTVAGEELEQLVHDFDDELNETFTDVRMQFLEAAMGFTGAPVHYPRLGQPDGSPSAPDDRSMYWFVANERGPRHSLPGLGEEAPPTLPYLAPPQRRDTQRRNTGRPDRRR